jgi:hypothetical protein
MTPTRVEIAVMTSLRIIVSSARDRRLRFLAMCASEVMIAPRSATLGATLIRKGVDDS